ncbi:hypothetical protein [Geopsychrobacter electrodiphilus]|uniref:hypothetical protein n=1 Tax=Geopsychrobacter electrodiphilus TaxID=225196 RepID=UPI00036A0BF0|nr:hypothetical protein [Geopsychrobacter electrodiphilus]
MKTAIILMIFITLPLAALASRAGYRVTVVKYYRSARGDNSVRVRITSEKWKNISIRSNHICARSETNELTCGNGSTYIDLKSGESVLIDMGQTKYPLTQIYINE